MSSFDNEPPSSPSWNGAPRAPKKQRRNGMYLNEEERAASFGHLKRALNFENDQVVPSGAEEEEPRTPPPTRRRLIAPGAPERPNATSQPSESIQGRELFPDAARAA
jgi:hypothetical protein